jgi:hypothetical protein
MTKEKFKELTGENPIDLFGSDWENEMLGLMGDDEYEDNPEEEEEDNEDENDLGADGEPY